MPTFPPSTERLDSSAAESKMQTEIWDLYTEDGARSECRILRGEPIPQGYYHLVSEILVRHIDGDYLLMQRDPRKQSYGGRFEASAGGSAMAGEDAITCAKRELWEETGLTAHEWKHLGSCRSGNEMYHQFLCLTDCPKSSVRLQEGETVSYRWLSEAEFAAFVRSGEMIDFQREHFADYFEKMKY